MPALSALASLNEVNLVWVPVHCGITMSKLISLLDERQLCLYLVQNRLLEYLDVPQENQLRT